jgi:outer membrane murein-binding lipoprotein Lpp
MMNRVLIAVCAALLVAGCGSKGGTSQQSKAAVEQRDLFQQKDQQAADAEKSRHGNVDSLGIKPFVLTPPPHFAPPFPGL